MSTMGELGFLSDAMKRIYSRSKYDKGTDLRKLLAEMLAEMLTRNLSIRSDK